MINTNESDKRQREPQPTSNHQIPTNFHKTKNDITSTYKIHGTITPWRRTPRRKRGALSR